MPGIALEIKRKCKVCGKVFLVRKLDSQFCSKRCSAVDLKRRRDAEVKEARLAKIAAQVPDIREYISVREAVALYHIERGTLYRLIRLGRIPAMNFGKHLIRIKRSELEANFMLRKKGKTREGKANPQTLQPRTRELLYRWRDMQEVSHQRQHRMGACTEVLYPLTTNRQLCLYPQRRNR